MSERPDQEGFGEASLGEAQSENPPNDPEYIEGDATDNDPDSGPGTTPEDVEQNEERDQAEG